MESIKPWLSNCYGSLVLGEFSLCKFAGTVQAFKWCLPCQDSKLGVDIACSRLSDGRDVGGCGNKPSEKKKDARGLGKKAMPSLSLAPARFSHLFQDLCTLLSWNLEQARVEIK